MKNDWNNWLSNNRFWLIICQWIIDSLFHLLLQLQTKQHQLIRDLFCQHTSFGCKAVVTLLGCIQESFSMCDLEPSSPSTGSICTVQPSVFHIIHTAFWLCPPCWWLHCRSLLSMSTLTPEHICTRFFPFLKCNDDSKQVGTLRKTQIKTEWTHLETNCSLTTVLQSAPEPM